MTTTIHAFGGDIDYGHLSLSVVLVGDGALVTATARTDDSESADVLVAETTAVPSFDGALLASYAENAVRLLKVRMAELGLSVAVEGAPTS